MTLLLLCGDWYTGVYLIGGLLHLVQ